MLHALTSRQLISVKSSGGKSVVDFLQGLVTQDMRRFEKTTTNVLGTVFLNSKGRMLVDGLIWKRDAQSSYFVDVPVESADHIASMLVRHKLREPFSIEVVPTVDLAVHVDVTRTQGESDPRSIDLPTRMIQKPDQFSSELEQFEERFKSIRMKACVPEGPSEIPYDSAIPVFYNFDLMDSISLAKGCYTGQELVTRTLRRGVVRKRCFGLNLGQIADDLSNLVICSPDGTEIGRVVASAGGYGIGLVQLGGNPLNDRMQVQAAWDRWADKKVIVGNGIQAEMFLPKYVL